MCLPRRCLPLLVLAIAIAPSTTFPQLEPDRYSWQTAVAALGPDLFPVAAARCDRDRDGEPDLLVVYAGNGTGALVWVPVHAGRLGAPEPPRDLDFVPSAVVAGDFDADGLEELAFAVEGAPLLAVVTAAADGFLGEPSFLQLPDNAATLSLEDRPRRDGLPELLVDLPDVRLVAGSPRGALTGLASPVREVLPETAAPKGLGDAGRLILSTRLDADASPELVVAAPDGSVEVGTLLRGTIVVNSTDDSVDFGGAQQVADLPGPDGKTTLREAIIAANNTSGPHSIEFDILEAGNDFHDNAWWISPSDANLGPLPAITMADVTVDGGSQTSNQGDTNPDGPELVLDGSGLSSGNGLIIGPYCAVLDLVVQGFDSGGVGVVLNDADDAVVKGCYLGTSPDGLTAVGNTHGVMVVNGTTGAQVGGTGTHGTISQVPDRNLISGNAEGIHVNNATTTDNSILGNWIGTDRTGVAPLPNQGSGLIVLGGAGLTTIGGTTVGATNVIAGSGDAGIDLREGSSGNLIVGNLIGTDASGLFALPNGAGVSIRGGSPDNTVGGTSPAARNLISGNAGDGARIQDPGTDGTVVQGNWIGLDGSGSSALPNQWRGIATYGGASNTSIGGGGAGEGNVISGNGWDGIEVNGSSTVVIRGNRVGTDPDGNVAVSNTGAGVRLGGGTTGTTVGGALAGEGNLLSGNWGEGIVVTDPGTDGNVIAGNFIGTDVTGTAAIPNAANGGVNVSGGATSTLVGGGSSGEGNLIAGNAGPGVFVQGAGTDGTVIQGNRIGLASNGSALGNSAEGVVVLDGARGTEVGGPGLAANEIAHSGSAGVAVTGSSLETRVTGNSIHSNNGLGVDLGEDGVTANDVGDDDEGPNRLVNYPVLSSAINACGAGTTVVTGTVDTASPQLGSVELFSCGALDPSGFGEADTPRGTFTPALDGTFTATLAALPLGHFVTATFTDSAGNTSELSAGVQVLGTPFAPASLHTELTSGPSVDLGWVDASFDESSFRLERRVAGGSFAFLTALPPNTSSYHDPGPLAAGATYYYRVRAEAGGCISPWSNVASVTIPGATSAFCRSRLTHHRLAANPSVEYASGGSFGAAWRDVDANSTTIVYARLDATGALVSGPIAVAGGDGQAGGQVLAWDGAAWGMAWLEQLGDRWGLFFRRLDLDGTHLGPPVKVSEEAGRPEATNVMRPGLEWDGSGWGLAWVDSRSGTRAVYYAHLDPSGAKETADVLVSDSPAAVGEPTLEFTGTGHTLTWLDYRNGDGQVWLRQVALDGSTLAPSVQVTSEGVANWFQDTEWSGSELGLTWSDGREGDYRVYFRRLAADGTPLSPETLIQDVTPPPDGYSSGNDLTLRFADDRWVVSADGGYESTPSIEIMLMFADLAGAKRGPDIFASSSADGRSSDFPGLAWGDGTLLAAWHDTANQGALEVHAQAMDPAGTPTASPRVLTATGGPGPGVTYWPSIAFTGTRSAVVWPDSRADAGGWDLYLRLTDGAGQPVTGEVQVADTYPAHAGFGPAGLAFSGEALAVGWADGFANLWLSRFGPGGSKLGGDLQLAAGNARVNGAVPVSWTGEAFLVAWSDARDGNWEVYTAAVTADGSLLGGPSRVSEAGGRSENPALAGDGVARIAVWADSRDGNWEIYAASLSPSGQRTGPEVRVTDNPANSTRPWVAWNGDHFLAAWSDARTGRNEVWARLFDAGGTPLGADLQLTADGGSWPRVVATPTGWTVAFSGLDGLAVVELDATAMPTGPAQLFAIVGAGSRSELFGTVGWDGNQPVVAYTAGLYWTSEVYLTSVACASDTTPPSCPVNLTGDPVGASVTLGWSPGTEPDFAADWQKVYRDDLLVAALSPDATGWVDPMVATGPHTYRVTTLNQGRVESPGCDEIAVYASASCVATRDLPDVYGGGTPFTVTISTGLPPSASTHAAEDAPPAGWAVSNISDGGLWDPASQRVKWVFFDNLPRNLTYSVTPPAGTTGTFPFAGVVSVDGGSQSICGDSEVSSGPPHPADLNDDWRMVINEVTGYATAWRTGQTWPEPPNPIPIAYVTNAAYLYRSGELYHYLLGAYPPYAPGTEAVPQGNGSALSTFDAPAWSPGTPLAVTIRVTPNTGSLAWAAEDRPPAGWTVTKASHGGVWDSVNGKVKWGPFLDHSPRTLQYTVTPTVGSGFRTFVGTASFDGHNVPVAGARSIRGVVHDVDADRVTDSGL